MRKIKINSLYKHFKGHIYKVIAIGKNSEDLTDMVVYENIENHEIWIRPYDMFNSLVWIKTNTLMLNKNIVLKK